MTYQDQLDWAKIKKRQANEASHVGDIAGGIGEYRIANACYHLSEILTQQAHDLLVQEVKDLGPETKI